jgi:hypothetical protein
MMFCLVRRNSTGTARYAAEITSLIQATWGTLNLRAIRGFQGFYGLVSHDDEERIASASFYSDKEAASAANTVIDVWVRTHAGQFLSQPPEVFIGECFVNEASEPRDTSLYCSIRAWRAGGDFPTVKRLRQCLTGIVREDGFRGSCGFLDEVSGNMIAVTLFATVDRAGHSHGMPGGTLWTTTGNVVVAARSWDDLRKGFW